MTATRDITLTVNGEPISRSVPVRTNLVDFLLAAVVLAGRMVYYGFVPGIEGVLVLPLLLLISLLAALGGGLFLAAVIVI